jgi:hypothetical protein
MTVVTVGEGILRADQRTAAGKIDRNGEMLMNQPPLAVLLDEDVGLTKDEIQSRAALYVRNKILSAVGITDTPFGMHCHTDDFCPDIRNGYYYS